MNTLLREALSSSNLQKLATRLESRYEKPVPSLTWEQCELFVEQYVIDIIQHHKA